MAVAVADGFLGRWSQRKQAAAEGKPLAEPVPAPIAAPQKPASSATQTHDVAPTAPDSAPAPPPPTLSLDDVKELTADSNYAPFVNRNVAPDVRNAAMKKLFTDPHYNVMDGLDIYIDDYSLPDPLPASMLRKMASAQFLKLCDDEQEGPTTTPRDSTAPVPSTVPATPPESAPPQEQTPCALDETQNHDDPDLRLQPNHAAGPQAPGHGTE